MRRNVRLHRPLLAVAAAALALTGCKREEPEMSAPPLSALKPAPLPDIGASPSGRTDSGAVDGTYRVESVPIWGDDPPKNAARLELHGEQVLHEGAPLSVAGPEGASRLKALAKGGPILLVPDADTFLAQAAALLALLDDVDAKVWLLHPRQKVAFPLALKDEPAFQQWLDAQTLTGKIRLIHRADGYELQTNLGKLPGYDPNGPSVPLRGGQWDLARLRAALVALEDRFDRDEEACIVPSFGMELAEVAVALTGFYDDDEDRLFETLCLVYPRPPPGTSPGPDAGPASP